MFNVLSAALLIFFAQNAWTMGQPEAELVSDEALQSAMAALNDFARQGPPNPALPHSWGFHESHKRTRDFIDEAMKSVVYVMTVIPREKAPPQMIDQVRRMGLTQEQLPKYLPIGHGTGFIYSEDGRIFTNAHVVEEAAKGNAEILIKFSSDELFHWTDTIQPRDTDIVAKILASGKPGRKDIAILKLPAHAGVKWPALKLGSTTKLKRGITPVWVLGFPLTSPSNVTPTTLGALNIKDNYLTYLQTNAGIHHGDSGGPTIDREGRVIGMNTAFLADNGGNQGLGRVLSVEDLIRTNEQYNRVGDIDVGYANVPLRILGDRAVVGNLDTDSPAREAGLREGDIIIKEAGESLPEDGELAIRRIHEAAAQLSPGDTLTLTVLRAGVPKTVDIVLEREPDAPTAFSSGAADEPILASDEPAASQQ